MKIRKFTALMLVAAMLAMLFTGCQKAMDAQTLVQKMSEAGKNVTESAGKMSMEMEMTMAMTGMTMDFGVGMNAEYKSAMEPVSSFADMSVSFEIMGQTETMDMTMYTAQEDGAYVSYVYESATETWTRTEAEEVPDLSGTASMDLTQLPAENMKLEEEKQTIGDREVYVLDCTITGTLMNEMLASILNATGAELDGETKTVLETMDMSAMTILATYYVDCETFLPLQSDMEIQGMGALMSELMGSVLGEAMLGMDAEAMELTFDVTTFNLSMTDMRYTDVEVPSVPQEGIDAAALNPLQSDGSYVLRLSEDAVRVVCPEGLTAYDNETAYLALMTEDYMTSVEYSLTEDVTAADMPANVDAWVQDAKEYEMYDSHGTAEEINGFSVMYLHYNDGTAYYFAWKELDSCLLLVSVYGTVETLDMNSILNAVADYEG